MDLKFKLNLIRQINKSDLSFREKRQLRTAIMWRPDVVAFFKQELSDVAAEKGLKDIDWENFDWEAAAEFWVKIIEAVAKIILAVI
jgi:hypothetical protein